jgi:hypothetical protein
MSPRPRFRWNDGCGGKNPGNIMTLLSIGDEVREGTYWLHSRFDHAINFTDGRHLVTLVTPDTGAGPVNIVVATLPPAPASPARQGGPSAPSLRSDPCASGLHGEPFMPDRLLSFRGLCNHAESAAPSSHSRTGPQGSARPCRRTTRCRQAPAPSDEDNAVDRSGGRRAMSRVWSRRSTGTGSTGEPSEPDQPGKSPAPDRKSAPFGSELHGERCATGSRSKPSTIERIAASPHLPRSRFGGPGSARTPMARDPKASADAFPCQPAHAPPTLARSSRTNPVDEVLLVGRYSILLANRRWSLTEAQSYESSLHIYKEASGTVFRRNLKTLERFLAAEAHPKSLAFLLDDRRIANFRTSFEKAMVRRITEGVKRMPRRDGVTRLAGCGFGLTPGGDDFIAGALVALNVLQALTGRDLRGTIQNIWLAGEGESLLSNAFLRLARDGKVTERSKDLVSALVGRSGAEVRRNARRLLDVGATSGADWMTGFVMTAGRGAMERWSDGEMGRVGGVCSCHPSTPGLQHSAGSSEDLP